MTLPRLSRLGARDHAQRRRRRRRLLRLLAAGARGERRHRRRARPARPSSSTLRSTQGSVHVSVPPGRYQVEAESAAGSHERPRPRRGDRRAVRDPGAEQLGRRVRRGPPVIAALEPRPPPASAPRHAAAYLVVNMPIAILGALVACWRCVLGAALSVAVDRAAAAAGRGGRLPAARAARPPRGQPLPRARTSRRVPGGVRDDGQPVAALARTSSPTARCGGWSRCWPPSRC